MIKLFKKLLVLTALIYWSGVAQATLITNGSFETGTFAGWTTQDLSTPFSPLSIQTAGTNTFGWPWSSTPTHGTFTAFHGFDGDGTTGPNPIRISQDITVTSGQAMIDFDYRGAWDLITFCGNCLNRIFDVNIEVAGGGANLANFNILTATAGTTVNDTGQLTGWVDLSAFVGQTVHLAFDWFIPDNFSGPAQFQLDNVRISVPEPAGFALLVLGMITLVFTKKTKR
jgi:hypothetical protein